MIEQIGIFILFLFPLVFFHELGHFFFAKLFNVRVDTFSIGFGPKLLKKKIGETEYAVSLIPLGGYVKMYGENILDKKNIPQEEKERSLVFKSKWQRFWIVFGGPLANIVFSFVLFFILGMSGEKVPEIRLGTVNTDTALYKEGFRTADLIIKINGEDIFSPTDIQLDEKSLMKSITVLRGVEDKVINPKSMNTMQFFDEFKNSSSLMRMPVVYKGTEQYVVSLTASKVDWDISFEEILNVNNSTIYLFKAEDALARKADLTTKIALTGKNVKDILIKNSLYPTDLFVKGIISDSASSKAGLKESDVIIKIDNKYLTSFEDLRYAVKNANPSIETTVLRDGKELSFALTPKIMEIDGEERKMIGVESGALFLPPKYRTMPSKGIIKSIPYAFGRTIDTIKQVATGFGKLLTGKVSVKSIGGPLAIGEVAASSFYMSFTFFLQIMSMVSINLALINLFPIPVLDGGHIVFIIMEFINKGPISNRKIEIAQQIGLSLLLILMFGAIFNDVSRYFHL